jgi:PAS domain S-box-containing protein
VPKSDLEKECGALRARVAELEARLAEQARSASGLHQNTSKAGANGAGANGAGASASLLEAVFKSIPDAIIVSDGDRRLLRINPAAEALFGDDLAALGAPHSPEPYGLYRSDGISPFPESELPVTRALRGESAEGLEVYARSASQPQGRWVECTAKPLRDESGALRGAVVVGRDISERRRRQLEREQTLRAGELDLFMKREKALLARLFQTVLENLEVVVWAVDKKGVFMFHDGHGLDILGIPRGQFVGQNIHDLYGGHDSAEALDCALRGETFHHRTEYDGTAWENWYIPMRDESSAITGVLGVSLDITESYMAKAELMAKLSLIERQQEVIRELETPVIQVWDRVLTLPMVGVVDSQRSARMMNDLLDAVTRTQSAFAILDLTGVELVDTATAGHILSLISAVRLLGAEGIITGIRPNIAETIVSLGLDLSRVVTLATLRDGLAFAIRKLGARR